MNLVTDYINELGGYEVAKKKNTSWLLNHGENWRNVKDATLLEYRRQHNIFEVGDEVIVLINALGNKYTWKVKSIDGCMVEISQIGQPDEWVHFSEIAHATDEEIKAGKRLEVS